jgi:hypothetical protein
LSCNFDYPEFGQKSVISHTSCCPQQWLGLKAKKENQNWLRRARIGLALLVVAVWHSGPLILLDEL